jgi:hypothetical protein
VKEFVEQSLAEKPHSAHIHSASYRAPPPPPVTLNTLDVTCDAARYITGGSNPELCVYDMKTNACVQTLGLSPDRTGQVARSVFLGSTLFIFCSTRNRAADS